jgi:hypothetical protein
MTRVDLPISEAQQQYVALFAFLALMPVSWFMYNHWRSMQRRYPSAPAELAKKTS